MLLIKEVSNPCLFVRINYALCAQVTVTWSCSNFKFSKFQTWTLQTAASDFFFTSFFVGNAITMPKIGANNSTLNCFRFNPDVNWTWSSSTGKCFRACRGLAPPPYHWSFYKGWLADWLMVADFNVKVSSSAFILNLF